MLAHEININKFITFVIFVSRLTTQSQFYKANDVQQYTNIPVCYFCTRFCHCDFEIVVRLCPMYNLQPHSLSNTIYVRLEYDDDDKEARELFFFSFNGLNEAI